MSVPVGRWHIVCSPEVARRCREDEKFPYLVALSRAVNALLYSVSILEYVSAKNDPAATRDRFNSYLFGTGIMYEALQLLRNMGKTFKDDDLYQQGLRPILKDRRALEIELEHMNPARNKAIFHFDPERFGEAIRKSGVTSFAFFSGLGKDPMNVNFVYSDIVTAEILTGVPSEKEEFFTVLEEAMEGTRELLSRFTYAAHSLVAARLKDLGFEQQNEQDESTTGTTSA